MDVLNCTPQQWLQKESEWLEEVQKDETWNKIPLVNVNELHNLKDSRLVKFRGMIQDMHGPEFYLEKYEVINLDTREVSLKDGRFVDVADCKPNETINPESPATVRAERQSYVAISIPAVNDWVQTLVREQFPPIETPASTSPASQTKRPLDEAMEVDSSTNPLPENSKKQCTQQETPKPNFVPVISTEHILNFPIPDPKGRVCHLKVYKGNEVYKLNSICDFVGFLSVDPSLACINDDTMDDVEFQTHNPPPSLVPRIHCVAFRKLTHCNPLVENDQLAPEKMKYLQEQMLTLLSNLLFGDKLAAEYLLYYLMSEVYLRKDFMALGKFSLNISNVPIIENFDFVKELYKFIETLVPKSHYLAMSLDNMNDLAFMPTKDYASNRLTSSILQLSKNTSIVLDETKLAAGKLNPAGVDAVKALANAIKNQKVLFDFKYYKIEFDCDLPFLVMSEGKSMLPSDCHVVLKPDDAQVKTSAEILDCARFFLKPELLNDLRRYLTLARSTKYEISDNIHELVQKEFVGMRQKGNVTGDDLHSLLVLARLVCISQGKDTLDEECWHKACTLEEARKERIKT